MFSTMAEGGKVCRAAVGRRVWWKTQGRSEGVREDLMQWPPVSLQNMETAAKSCKVQDRWVVRELHQTLEEAWVGRGPRGHMAGRAKGLLWHRGLNLPHSSQGKSGGLGGEQVKASVLRGGCGQRGSVRGRW